MRDFVAAADDQSGRTVARGLQPGLDGAHHKMRRIERNLTRPLALNLQLQAGFSCLDDDFVVKAERKPQAVEARPRFALEAATTAVAVSPAGRV